MAASRGRAMTLCWKHAPGMGRPLPAGRCGLRQGQLRGRLGASPGAGLSPPLVIRACAAVHGEQPPSRAHPLLTVRGDRQALGDRRVSRQPRLRDLYSHHTYEDGLRNYYKHYLSIWESFIRQAKCLKRKINVFSL